MRLMGALGGLILPLVLAGCPNTPPPKIPVSTATVKAGGEVTFFKGEPHKLAGVPVQVGDPLPKVTLVDALSGQEVELQAKGGTVLLLSIVPSIDTAVCSEQTSILSQEASVLPSSVRRVTISMDTPKTIRNFALSFEIDNVEFLSDAGAGAFGLATGLLVEDLHFLARAVLVVDGDGVIRYMQVVPEIGDLPDMPAAFEKAASLAR
jgi:thiol peroxidase